jgi:hypothetical protein
MGWFRHYSFGTRDAKMGCAVCLAHLRIVILDCIILHNQKEDFDSLNTRYFGWNGLVNFPLNLFANIGPIEDTVGQDNYTYVTLSKV